MAKLRAPSRHGDLLLEPSTGLSAQVRANEEALNAATLWGRALSEWRTAARAEVFERATHYTSDLFAGGLTPLRSPAPQSSTLNSQSSFWFVGGHQPELYHPGVWAKNAVVHELAAQNGGVALNLTVDHDLCSGAAVSVPRGRDQAGMTSLEWDIPRPQCPWEERPQPDPPLFASFGTRCQDHLRPWGIDPLAAAQDWSGATDLALVDRLVRLRGQFERQAGFANLELRVSELSETECFQQFIACLVQHAEPFANTYNQALTQYRNLHHVRSQSHPVPALSIDSRGVELPLWVWRASETRRRPLYVRQGSLHDGQREIGSLASARQNGWKIRPRALSLTLFCRLLLGSAFIHGIGGALYDQMTDTIIRDLIGITPPTIIVATATMRLFEPFAGPDPGLRIVQLERDRRALRWNPELLVERVAGSEEINERLVLELISRKQLVVDKILATKRVTLPDDQRARHQKMAGRHEEIQSLNQRLRMYLPADLGESIDAQLVTLHHRRPHWASLCSREFSSNLFPAVQIRELFRNIRQQVITNSQSE